MSMENTQEKRFIDKEFYQKSSTVMMSLVKHTPPLSPISKYVARDLIYGSPLKLKDRGQDLTGPILIDQLTSEKINSPIYVSIS